MSTKPSSTNLDSIKPRLAKDTMLVASHPAETTPVERFDEPKVTGGKVSRLHWLTKKRMLIIAACALITIACGVVAWSKLTRSAKPVAKTTTVTPKPTPTPTPVPTTAPAALTGLPVPIATATYPVIGVIIENLYPYARPQSGLSEAGEVYEALAEGGITRFLALFQEPLPSSLGPVRSLRPYFLDWGLEHNIPVAHAGGSQPALAEIGPLGMKDINALRYDGSYFYRISSRFAPHNLYTSGTNLAKLDQVLGFARAPTFTSLPRKNDAPVVGPTHTDIKIPFSYAAYNVEYKYNAAANDYLRFEGGTPQTDMLTNQQIQVKNVVVQFAPVTYGTQDDGKPFTNYHLVGTGQALVFEDGTVIPATWSKASDAAQTQIDDTTGTAIEFNRGNTWFSVVPTGTQVAY